MNSVKKIIIIIISTMRISTKRHILIIVLCLVTQSCPTLCDRMDHSPPGSSVHRIYQTNILEWVAISFSRGSS